MAYVTHNDLVYAVAKRTVELVDRNIDLLRMLAAENGDTIYRARQEVGHLSRAQLVELIITNEFIEQSENNRPFQND